MLCQVNGSSQGDAEVSSSSQAGPFLSAVGPVTVEEHVRASTSRGFERGGAAGVDGIDVSLRSTTSPSLETPSDVSLGVLDGTVSSDQGLPVLEVGKRGIQETDSEIGVDSSA